MTLKELYNTGTDILKNASIQESSLDAWYLLEYVTGITRARYFVDSQQTVPQNHQKQYLQLIQKRAEHIPLQHLTGVQEFMGLEFHVNEHVLIPRQDTEILVETALEKLKEISNPVNLLDMCTGSGCIAIALAYAFPDAEVDATDISKDALEVAAINTEHHNMQYQVALLESDLFSKIPAENQYDLIVSNPPYVDAEDMADLPDEFRHEPELALAAGQDGLDLVRKMLAQAADYLTEDGLIVIEVGNSEWAMKQNFNTVDFHWLQFQKGGSGIFALTAAQCRQYRDLFIQSVNS